MRRAPYTIALAVLVAAALAVAAPATAEGFRVPPQKRVENIDPGYCGWCAIETIAKTRAPYYPGDKNYAKLLTVVEYRKTCLGEPCVKIWTDGSGRREETRFDPGTTYPSVVRKQLKEFGVTYRDNLPVREGGTKDFDFLVKACKDRHGAMVAVQDCLPISTGSHALAVTDISDEEEEFAGKDGKTVKDIAVYYYDSNHTQGVFRVSKTWFMAAWDGWAVVVIPQGERSSPPAAGPLSQYPYVVGPKAAPGK